MGWASGFQAGSQVAKQALDTYNQVKLQQGLGAAFAKPETSQGYTAEDGKRLEELAKAGYDIVPQYSPAAEGQTQGLFTGYQAVPKAGVASFDASGGGAVEAPINIGLQQVQDYGGQRVAGQFDPNVLRGLQMREAARVLGASGDPVRAAQLEADAVRMEREAKEAPLRLKGLEQQVALGGQQLETGTLTLAEKKLQAEAAERMNKFNVSFGEANALAASEGRTLGAADIANLAKQNKLDFKQENELISSFVGRGESEVKQFRLDVEKLTQGKGLEQLLDLHKNDKRFGDGVHFVQEVDKKTGGFVLARVNEATGQIEERLPFKSKAEATAYLREEAVNPANAAVWLQNYKKTETGIEANRAQIRASDSTVSLNSAKTAQTNAQTKILNMNVEGNEKAKQLQTDLANLDQDDPMFATKQANLIAQFNALNVAPGKTIPMGGTGGKKGSVLQTPVELKKNDDGTYTAYSKEGGRALYNTYNGEEIPLGMEVDAYRKMKEAAVKNGVGLVTGEDNGRLVLKYTGADGKFYDDPQKAKYAKPTTTPPKAEGLDTGTRVVAPAAPTAPTAKPVREPNESFSAFRDRTVAWDRNRMAYEQYANDERVKAMLSKNASGLNLNKRPLVDN